MSADRITGLLRRVFRRALDTSTPSQQVQIESLADEVHGDVEELQPYGLATAPPDDVTEGLAAFVGGQSDHGVVLGWFDKLFRPRDLLPGEIKLYSKFGQTVFLDAAGGVLITDAAGSTYDMRAGAITLTPSAGTVLVQGNIHATGGLLVDGPSHMVGALHSDVDVTAGAISLIGHVHGGIVAGGGNTAVPH